MKKLFRLESAIVGAAAYLTPACALQSDDSGEPSAESGGGMTSTGGDSLGGETSAGGDSSGGNASGGSGGSAVGGSLAFGGSWAGAGGAEESASGGTVGAEAGGATAAGGSGASEAVDAKAMVAEMGFGTNIGNTLENTTIWETGWGQPLITEAYIDGMKDRGINTVRVPVAWDTYATGGVLDQEKMNRVKEVVGWIDAAGMFSIVNIHWDGGWIFNESNANAHTLTPDVEAKFESYWQQISVAFAEVGHKLIFEGMNEEGRYYQNGDPNQAPDYTPLNTMNQLFVDTVRSQGGKNATRALLVAGFNTDIALTCVDDFKIPTDPAGDGKLFLSLHYYTPFTFCGLDSVESWGSPQTTWGTDEEKATLEGLFDTLRACSEAKNVPVILGEFAATPGENYVREVESRTLWMASVAKAAMARGAVPVLWDTGSEIMRTDGSFSPELEAVMNQIP